MKSAGSGGSPFGEDLIAGNGLQLNMKFGGKRIAAGPSPVSCACCSANNRLQRRQVRRLAAGDDIGRFATSSSSAGAEDLRASSTVGLATCAPRLGVKVTICTALSRCSTLRIPVRLTPNIGQRLLRQLAARQELMFDDGGHQGLIDGFILLRRWRGLLTVFITHSPPDFTFR
jgi:hypothetical protein